MEPKPQITEAALTSDIIAERYNSAVEAWGERGWAAVGRICRWAEKHGSTLPCSYPVIPYPAVPDLE